MGESAQDLLDHPHVAQKTHHVQKKEVTVMMGMNVKEILYAGLTIAKTSNRTLLILLTAVFDQSRSAMEKKVLEAAALLRNPVKKVEETAILMMSALEIWSVVQTIAETLILGQENFMTAVWMLMVAGVSGPSGLSAHTLGTERRNSNLLLNISDINLSQ